jgi:hypothetical protein
MFSAERESGADVLPGLIVTFFTLETIAPLVARPLRR